MKLKTVKDLVIWLRDYNLEKVVDDAKYNDGDDCVVRVRDLKDLAIKWIKSLRCEGHFKWTTEKLECAIQLFKEFHNITEDDLK